MVHFPARHVWLPEGNWFLCQRLNQVDVMIQTSIGFRDSPLPPLITGGVCRPPVPVPMAIQWWWWWWWWGWCWCWCWCSCWWTSGIGSIVIYIYIYIFKQAQLIKKRGLSRFRMSKVSCCKENEEGKCPLRKTGNLNPIEVLCWMGCPWDQVIPVDHVPCRYSAIKGAMSLPIVKNLKFSAKTIENIHEHLTCEYLRSKLQCPIAGWYASFSC